MSSAPAVSSRPAGTQRTPSRPATNTTTMASDHALPGTCSTTSATMPIASPTRATGSAPRRSAARPAHGAMIASKPAAAKNVAPSARPVAPRASRRSGASTSRTPKAGRRQRREPHAREHRALAQRRRGGREDLRAGAGAGIVSAHAAQREAEQHRGRERRLAPDRGGQRADHRAELHAEDRRAQDAADHLAATLARCLAGHPGHAARPRARAADALHEARDVEDDDRRAEGEGEPADGHERQPDAARWPSRPRAPPASRRAGRRSACPAA